MSMEELLLNKSKLKTIAQSSQALGDKFTKLQVTP